MVEVLIIADDFTGALDTGIQFAKLGIETQVLAADQPEHIRISPSAQVLAVNLETRPMSGADAYSQVYRLTEWAVNAGIQTIYKKTDSALRGNAGAEMKAVADATGEIVYFVPAYPLMNRVTRKGRLYVDGVLLENSVFGLDPFEPVRYSCIPDILRKELDVEVRPFEAGGCEEEKNRKPDVVWFDAETEQDMERITRLLPQTKHRCFAGCAGFAAFLPALLGLQGKERAEFEKKRSLYVACGSLNPITYRQLEYARRHGFFQIHLTRRQRMDPLYYETPSGKAFLEYIVQTCSEKKRVIVDSFDEDEDEQNDPAEKKRCRLLVSQCHGIILGSLICQKADCTYLITGGDTLMGVMKGMKGSELVPVCEIMKGAVLSKLKWLGCDTQVISKSGGFGEPDLLVRLADQLMITEVEDEVCYDAVSV